MHLYDRTDVFHSYFSARLDHELSFKNKYIIF